MSVKGYLKKAEPMLQAGESGLFACKVFTPTPGTLGVGGIARGAPDGTVGLAGRVRKGKSLLVFTDRRLLLIGDGLTQRGQLTAEFTVDEVALIDAKKPTINKGWITIRFADESQTLLAATSDEGRSVVKYLESARG